MPILLKCSPSYLYSCRCIRKNRIGVHGTTRHCVCKVLFGSEISVFFPARGPVWAKIYASHDIRHSCTRQYIRHICTRHDIRHICTRRVIRHRCARVTTYVTDVHASRHTSRMCTRHDIGHICTRVTTYVTDVHASRHTSRMCTRHDIGHICTRVTTYVTDVHVSRHTSQMYTSRRTSHAYNIYTSRNACMLMWLLCAMHNNQQVIIIRMLDNNIYVMYNALHRPVCTCVILYYSS